MKLLAINFGGLGDEVLFLPTLRSIKAEHPNWHITLLTEPRAKSITQVTDLIDANIAFDIKKRPLRATDYLELIGLLRSGRYDAVLSSGASVNVAGLLFLSGIKKRVGFGANSLAKLLLTNTVPLKRDQHAACMYHDLANGLGIKRQVEAPHIVAQQESLTRVKALMNSFAPATRRVLIHPGTSLLATQKGIHKGWSPDNWVSLVQKLIELDGTQVILSGGPDDESTIQAIWQRLEATVAQHPGKVVSVYGKTKNLSDLVALIHLSDLLVCVDSAPMHLGVALDKPLVALFGPTDPAKLLWPSERFKALRDEKAAQLFAGKDPFLTPSCSTQLEPYVEILPDTVFRIAVDQLNQFASPGSCPESQ